MRRRAAPGQIGPVNIPTARIFLTGPRVCSERPFKKLIVGPAGPFKASREVATCFNARLKSRQVSLCFPLAGNPPSYVTGRQPIRRQRTGGTVLEYSTLLPGFIAVAAFLMKVNQHTVI